MITIAKQAAQEASAIIQERFGRTGSVSFKDQDEDIAALVTEADFLAERKIRETIGRHFPAHAIMGEEGGRNAKQSEYCWLIDPIDGTVNYSRGIKHYGISIALAKNKKVILGVVLHPHNNELIYAEKGKGAFMNGQPIRVSSVTELSKAIIYSTELHRTREIVEQLFGVKQFRITSSSAYETALVAMGRTEAFIKVTSHPWGFAAASLVVEEAGGKVTNFDGSDWNIDSTHLLASNGLLHKEITSLLARE